MRRAIDLALLAKGRTSPNPLVGAVILDKNGELIATIKQHLGQYHGNIKLKVIANKDAYKLYYSTIGTHFDLFATLDGSSIKSSGYTGAHLGLYATSNGKETKDSASFDYVNYLIKKK